MNEPRREEMINALRDLRNRGATLIVFDHEGGMASISVGLTHEDLCRAAALLNSVAQRPFEPRNLVRLPDN